MKHLIARVGGLLVISAALAACSGSNSGMTPSTGSPVTTPQSMNRPLTPELARIASHFKLIGQPRFYYTRQHTQLAGIRPNAVGYPLDMSCSKKPCPVMSRVTSYNIYVSLDGKKCTTESCWGHPEEFLKGLTGSPLAKLLTQYTGGTAAGIKFGKSTSVTHTAFYGGYSNTFYNVDLFKVLLDGITNLKVAPDATKEFHIFLPPGVDTCFDQTGICYSPDNLSAFAFCAYHTAALYNNTPVIFSVEPWQNAVVNIGGTNVPACQVQNPPNLDNGTASTLSHELSESVSDPFPNTGYFNANYGMEIGDVCAYQFLFTANFGSKAYTIQQEYSNAKHGCANN
jgi:hypothetical protein